MSQHSAISLAVICRISCCIMALAALSSAPATEAHGGRQLYLASCAHCHADDATGDEGPDLHDLTFSDARLRAVILKGIKGEMPRFERKFSPQDLAQLIAYLRTLRSPPVTTSH